MIDYQFDFITSSAVEIDLDALARTFYNNFDGIVSSHHGRVFVTVDWSSEQDGEAAAKAAITALEDTLFILIERVDRDLVDADEIGRRLSRSRQNIHQLASGERGTKDFPKPIASSARTRLWEWSEVSEWAREHVSDFRDEARLTSDEAALIDAWLVMRKRMHQTTAIAEGVQRFAAALGTVVNIASNLQVPARRDFLPGIERRVPTHAATEQSNDLPRELIDCV